MGSPTGSSCARPRAAARWSSKGDPFADPVDVTPAGFNADTMVHEYGGGAYTVLARHRVLLEHAGRRLYRQDPGAAPVAITPETDATQRFADGVVTARRPVVDRRAGTPRPGSGDARRRERARGDARPTVDAEPRVLAAGHDFYSSPRISPDGATLALLAWDLPWMPWDGMRAVRRAAVAPRRRSRRRRRSSPAATARNRSGTRSGARTATSSSRPTAVAGGTSSASATASGEVAVSGRGGVRVSRSGRSASARSRSSPTVGSRVSTTANGRTHIAVLDPETGELIDLDLPYDALRWGPDIAIEGSVDRVHRRLGDRCRTRWCGSTSPLGRWRCCARASSVPVDTAYLSVPEAIEFPTAGGLTAHALFYPPANPDVDRSRGRAAAADRDRARWADERDVTASSIWAPVLDEPRVRRRRRRLRWLDRLRAGLPATAERALGRRRPAGLRGGGRLPDRARRRGRRSPASCAAAAPAATS